MRVVVALGGNAIAVRGAPLTVERQVERVGVATEALAALFDEVDELIPVTEHLLDQPRWIGLCGSFCLRRFRRWAFRFGAELCLVLGDERGRGEADDQPYAVDPTARQEPGDERKRSCRRDGPAGRHRAKGVGEARHERTFPPLRPAAAGPLVISVSATSSRGTT